MTLAEITAAKDSAFAAYQSALSKREYSIQSGSAARRLVLQDIAALRAEYEYWEARESEASGTAKRAKFIVPRY